MATNLSGRMSDAELIEISERFPGYQIELSGTGKLTMSPPSSNAGGAREAEAIRQLGNHAERLGGIAFSSSTGFTLPDGSVLSPDAAWSSPARVAIARQSVPRETFSRVLPDVVVEIRSPRDTWRETVGKCERWHDAGVAYALAIDPERRERRAFGGVPADLAIDVDRIIDAAL